MEKRDILNYVKKWHIILVEIIIYLRCLSFTSFYITIWWDYDEHITWVKAITSVICYFYTLAHVTL